MNKKSDKKLSREDQEIWRRVTKDAVRLHPILPLETPAPLTAKRPNKKPKQPTPKFSVGQNAQTSNSAVLPSLEKPSQLRMDKRTFAKMQKGKLSPERRLDLHGMTQSQAQPSLISFISKSHAAGCRLVLVITGKGKQSDDFGPIPSKPGVLKERVPNWLAQPPLSSMILQVTQASPNHGGSGALFVYLKRRR